MCSEKLIMLGKLISNGGDLLSALTVANSCEDARPNEFPISVVQGSTTQELSNTQSCARALQSMRSTYGSQLCWII